MGQVIFSFLVLLIFLGTTPTIAQTKEAGNDSNTSEFFHQAKAHQVELTPGLNYFLWNLRYNTTNPVEMKLSGTSESIVGEYGLNSNFSLGGVLQFTSGEFSYDPSSAGDKRTISGLDDPKVFFLANLPLPAGALHYGATLGLSLEKSKTNDSSNTGNVATGGFLLTPFIGYDLSLGPVIFGGQISYDVYKGDRSSEITSSSGIVTNSTSTDGQALSVMTFGELPLKTSTLGLSLGYFTYAKTKSKSSSGTVTQNNDSVTKSAIKLYGAFPIGRVTLLPSLTYNVLSFDDAAVAASISSYTQLELTCGARITF